MQKKVRKIALHRETLLDLDVAAVDAAAGTGVRSVCGSCEECYLTRIDC